uniref:F-box/LRR-repeat protein 15-like n=1 Tax=Saccoglossus kowalevskii TaxID=10224 RepID=A0ABM0GKL3_SACKO|nr:PREDICTED: F-box/LRR-repeat protein 15-like [Saccoglossus kowalevskii]
MDTSDYELDDEYGELPPVLKDGKEVSVRKSEVYEWDEEEYVFDERYLPYYSIIEALSLENIFEVLSHLEWYELCTMSQTCTAFHDICNSPSLWQHMKKLNFTKCKNPNETDVFHIAQRCPKAVLAITAKCTGIQRFKVSYSNKIQKSSILDLVSSHVDLQELYIKKCSGVSFLNLEHQTTLNAKFQHLKSISLIECFMDHDNFVTMATSCPTVEDLDLSKSHIDFLSIGPNQAGADVVKADFKQLKSLALNTCTDLTKVEVYQNVKLEKISMNNCMRLASLKLQCENVADVSVSGCYALEWLDITSTKLSEMILSYLPGLQNIKLECNNLAKLDLSHSTCIIFQCLLESISLSNIRSLNIIGCIQFNPDDISDKLLPKLTCLHELLCGGHSWSHSSYNNNNIKRLSIRDAVNLWTLEMNCSSVEKLEIDNCACMMESELFETLSYGKRVERKRRSSRNDDTVVTIGGVPNVQHLTLSRLGNLNGKNLSIMRNNLIKLQVIELVKCDFVKIVELTDWPELCDVRVIGSPRLSTFTVSGCPQVSNINLMWCGAVDSFHITANKLQTLNTAGCVFKDFHLQSTSLEILNVAELYTLPSAMVNLCCPNLKSLSLNLQLSAMRKLKDIKLDEKCQLSVLFLNNLPKLAGSVRDSVLSQCSGSLKELEIRGLPRDCSLGIHAAYLVSLTLNNCRNLTHLDIICPGLKYLRIQGCPSLTSMMFSVDELTSLDTAHSSQLVSLKTLHLCSNDVKFLARMLAIYCPNLQELILSGHRTTMNRILSAGHSLPHLHTVRLHNCEFDVELRKHNPGPLVIDVDKLHRSESSDDSLLHNTLSVYFT